MGHVIMIITPMMVDMDQHNDSTNRLTVGWMMITAAAMMAFRESNRLDIRAPRIGRVTMVITPMMAVTEQHNYSTKRLIVEWKMITAVTLMAL